jgi:hypothetical protein
MSAIEQLFNSHIHHLRSGNSTNPSTEKDLGSSTCKDNSCFRVDAKTHGQHEELRRIQREPTFGQPTMHSILWYVFA